MLDLIKELKELTRTFAERNVPYALCGGLAMAVHKLARATIDIDLLIPAEALADVWAVAQERGFDIKGLDMTFAGGAVEIRRISRIERESGEVLTLDLLLVTPQLREAWETRLEATWQGEPLWVVSAEGLIQLKSFRNSGQDQDDIKRLRGENVP